MELYHQRKFSKALEKFEKLLKSYPSDGPAKIYAERCEIFKSFPPPENWDGVMDMQTK